MPELHRGTLAESSEFAGGKRVIVALGSAFVSLRYATVPSGRHAVAAVPYVLEEELADDIEDLQFAVGTAEHDGTLPVAVINRQILRRVLEMLQEHGLQPREIVPDVQCLPLGESDEWEAWIDEEEALIRQGRHAGLWLRRELLDTMLPMLIDEAGESAPAQITWFCQDHLPLPELPLLSDRITVEDPTAAFARGLSAPRINLLQGEFHQRKQYRKYLLPWRVPAALAATLLLCFSIASYLELRNLRVLDSQQQTQMVNLYKTAFPGARTVQEPVVQLRSRLNTLRSDSHAGALDLIAVLGDVLTQANGATLNSLVFRLGRAEVEIMVASVQELDRIKSLLEENGKLSATVRSANQQQDGVRGRLRLEVRA